MTSSDEGEDRELLERYGRARAADPRAPSAAVRAAILDEGRRVAASLSASPVSIEPVRRRTSRWKMTAWGTAAAVLLVALMIAPRLREQSPMPLTHGVAISPADSAFNQAARKTASVDSTTELREVVPVVPVPGPRAENIGPGFVADAPTLRHPAAPPPPVHIPEQSVEITPLSHPAQNAELASLAQNRSMSSSYAAGSNRAQQNAKASPPLLTAAAAAGDVVKTTQLLDQGAPINDHDASGRTPLMLAVAQDRLDTVRLLLNRGADPNATDPRGLTPLRVAQQSKFDDIAALLIKAGAR
jgi:hypothetical protein